MNKRGSRTTQGARGCLLHIGKIQPMRDSTYRYNLFESIYLVDVNPASSTFKIRQPRGASDSRGSTSPTTTGAITMQC